MTGQDDVWDRWVVSTNIFPDITSSIIEMFLQTVKIGSQLRFYHRLEKYSEKRSNNTLKLFVLMLIKYSTLFSPCAALIFS